MPRTVYMKTGLTGEDSTYLDYIDGKDLIKDDVAIVTVSNNIYFYRLDNDNSSAESSPTIIKPNKNYGAKRWVLQSSQISKGVYYVSNYASLTAAIAAIGATEGTLVIDTDTTVTANLVIPVTLSILCLKGNLISHTTFTITVNGNFDAGLFQVFNGTGAVTFGVGTIEHSIPQWWGENTTPGTTDMTAELQAAINAYGNVYIPVGTYKITTKLTVPNERHIKGAGAGKTIIQASGCIGLEFTGPGGEEAIPYVISDFTIDGLSNTSETTGRGINIPGSASTSNIVYGLRIRNIKFLNINTGIYIRTARDIEIDGCGFYTFHGVRILGQVVLSRIHHCDIIHVDAMGTGSAYGIQVDSATNYDPGGTTEHIPEDFQAHHNRIYGHDYGCDLSRVLFVGINNNDFDNIQLIGTYVLSIRGGGTISSNWIALGNIGATHGIKVDVLGASQDCNVVINNNTIRASLNATDIVGISVDNFQRAIIDGNSIDLLTPTAGIDILVGPVGSTSANTIITNNYCYSNITNSISMITGAGGVTKVDGNYLRAALYIHPTAFTDQLDIGYNVISGSPVTTKTFYGITALKNGTSPGQLDLYEGSAGGTNKISLVVPSALGADGTVTVPEGTGSVKLNATATHNYAAGHADWTLSATESQCSYITVSNADAGVNALIPTAIPGQDYLIYNGSGQTLTFMVTGQTGGTIANGKYALYKTHATDVIEIWEQP